MTMFRSALGIPVIERSSAEQIGTVKHFVVEDGKVHALHVDGGKRHGQLVAWSAISSFGEDAVVVDDTDALREAQNDRESRAARGELVMLDKRVLDDSGDELGVVTDVAFDPSDGTIESLTVGASVIAGERLHGVGSYAVVVASPDDTD